MSKIKAILSIRYFPIIMGIFIFILHLPHVGSGLTQDDYIQYANAIKHDALVEKGISKAPDEITLKHTITTYFDFFSDNIEAGKEYGQMPWWTSEKVQMKFFRPLTSFTHWIDLKLWPNSFAMFHIHQMLLLSLLIITVGYLFRRLIGDNLIAGLATFFFAINFNFFIPTVFLACRNLILSALFGALTFFCYIIWQKRSNNHYYLLTLLLFGLTLLSAEAGIATMAFILAHILFMDERTWSKRIGYLLPFIGIILVWRYFYQHLGFGTFGGGMYADPIYSTASYMKSLATNFPILAFMQLTGEIGLSNNASASIKLIFIAVACIYFIVFAVAFTPIIKINRLVRFLLAGFILSIIPFAAINLPSGRLLFFAGICGCALASILVITLLRKVEFKNYGKAVKISAWIVAGIFLLRYLLVNPGFYATSALMKSRGVNDDPMTRLANDDVIESKPIVLINAPNAIQMVVYPFERAVKGLPLPPKIRILAPGFTEVKVTRTAVNELEIETYGYLTNPSAPLAPEGGPYSPLGFIHLSKSLMGLIRDDKSLFESGDTEKLSDINITILEVDIFGQPIKVRFNFLKPMESYSWKFWDWKVMDPTKARYFDFSLPEIGKSFVLVGAP